MVVPSNGVCESPVVKPKSVVFRADASLRLGSGHVMRCLTLAEELRGRGAVCHFVCRRMKGDLIELIRDRGFRVSVLFEAGSPECRDIGELNPGDQRLRGFEAEDAQATSAVVGANGCSWLVVDHYYLAEEWERAMRPLCNQLLVIDDLADRRHDCDMVINQNLGRSSEEYIRLVREDCVLLIGPRYALLRSEFAELRDYSLHRRRPATLRNLLISMGGVDSNNTTGRVLDEIVGSDLSSECTVTVVMGLHAPWAEAIKARASALAQPCRVRTNVDDMARLIAESDLVVGGAGVSSWERCCLGVPSLIVILAENQRSGAQALRDAGCAHLLGEANNPSLELRSALNLVSQAGMLEKMSERAASICDGRGVSRIIARMFPEGA